MALRPKSETRRSPHAEAEAVYALRVDAMLLSNNIRLSALVTHQRKDTALSAPKT